MSNVTVSIEQQVEWIALCLTHMGHENLTTIEPIAHADTSWADYTNATSEMTLFLLEKSWYMGANVPGKPHVCWPYLGGVGAYRRICNDIAEQDYLGFVFDGPDGTRCNDGLVRRQQPDVVAMLEALEEMQLPAFDSMSPAEAREISAAMRAGTPT